MRVSAGTLQGFATAVRSTEGVLLNTLAALDQLEVRTRNSRYQITLLDTDDGRVLVQGGPFFPVPGEAQLSGSTLGGSSLKVGWLGCGFCLEFQYQGRRIVTTHVREIRKVELTTAA